MHQITGLVGDLLDDAHARIGRCCGGRVVLCYKPSGKFSCVAHFIGEHDTILYFSGDVPLTTTHPPSFLRYGAAEAMEVFGNVSVRGYAHGNLV